MKTIAISDEIWKELTTIRIVLGAKTYEDVIHRLILGYHVEKRKEEIKKEEVENETSEKQE